MFVFVIVCNGIRKLLELERFCRLDEHIQLLCFSGLTSSAIVTTNNSHLRRTGYYKYGSSQGKE